MTWIRMLALASVLACSHDVFAQQSLDTASVSGRVTDPSGGTVPGAQVSIRHTATNLTATVQTDAEGRFRFPHLRVGRYEVTARHQGFSGTSRFLTLTLGAAFELHLSLDLAAVDARVIVNQDAPELEAARSQIASTLADGEARTIPLNGRNFLELALLVPGVSPTNIASPQRFPETSAVPGISLSVAGQRNLSNNFIVDGLSANDDAAGLSGITYAVDAVEQVQVVTGGGQAELGRALGGHVTIVTKSGTNMRHGTAYTYLRDAALNARNHLSGTKLPMGQWQYGGSAGGPVTRDRTFYFGSAEQRRLDQSGLVTISPADVDVVNARLLAAGYQGRLLSTGTYPAPVDSTNALAKADHQVSGRNQLQLRYSRYDVAAQHSRGAGALNAPSAASDLDSTDQVVAVANTLTLSGRTVLETRAQFAHSDLGAPPVDPFGPAVSIAGVASFGTSSTSPTRRVNRLFQVVNSLSHHAGAHAFRAGVDLLHNDDRITFPRAARGSYAFASLASFLAGVYNNAGYTQTFGATEVWQRNPNIGIYVQDEWKVSPRITLNLGVRYDLQVLETIRTDAGNVSPRLGIAWSPFTSRRTVLRASGGLFYDRVPLRAVANALLSAGNRTDLPQLRQIAVVLSPAQAGAPVFPHTLPDVVPSTTPVNLTTMDRELQNARSQQLGVEIEQQVGDATTVSLAYQYLRGRQLLMAVNQNVPRCLPSGANNGCRPNLEYADNNQYSPVGSSDYHGLHVSVLQRPVRWGHYRVSYTLSRSMNDVGQFFFSAPIDPFDVSKDWGRSDDDQRHRLVISGAVRSPVEPAASVWQHLTHGFQVSGMLQAYAAPPFNILSGTTTLYGTAARPVVNGAFIPRNAGGGSSFMSLNARVSREIRLPGRLSLEAVAEIFNVTNRRNTLARNSTFGTGSYPDKPLPAFGRVTAVGEPRSLQLGLRVRF